MKTGIPEHHIDVARFDNREIGLMLRASRLRERYLPLPEGPRRALLQAMEEAYLAAASGIIHRLHGKIDSALHLEKMSDDRLELARRYFGGPTCAACFGSTTDGHPPRSLRTRRIECPK